MPAPPREATPEQRSRAIKNISMVIRGAGWAASAIFKSDEMRVPERDAIETAEAVLEGYPELALEPDADLKKVWAWAAVGSLALERYTIYQRTHQAPPALVRDTPRPSSSSSSAPATSGRTVMEIVP